MITIIKLRQAPEDDFVDLRRWLTCAHWGSASDPGARLAHFARPVYYFNIYIYIYISCA